MAGKNPADDAETSEKFYRFFQSESATLQKHIDRLSDTSLAGGEWNDAMEYCSAGIHRLSTEVKDASVYIPARDQRNYMESLKTLNTRLQEARETHAPKPKFTFKSARKRPSAMSLTDVVPGNDEGRLKIPGHGNSEAPSSADSSMAPTPAQIHTPPNETSAEDDKILNEDAETENPEVLALREAMIRKMSFSQAESVNIARQTHSHIILPPSAARATTTGTLSTLRRCVIDMSGPTGSTGEVTGRPFAGLMLKNIKDSLIVCGRVAGALHVTRLENSVVVASCRQFRMHESTNCDVYLSTSSRPIIEDCETIRFAPLPEAYKAGQQSSVSDQWDQVDDFKWLKSEPNPHWTILPDEERVGAEVWAEVVPGKPGQGVSDILKAVAVLK